MLSSQGGQICQVICLSSAIPFLKKEAADPQALKKPCRHLTAEVTQIITINSSPECVTLLSQISHQSTKGYGSSEHL